MKLTAELTPFRSAFSRKLAADAAKKAAKAAEQKAKDDSKKPVIPIVIHKPTYCVLIHHNINDEPIHHERHTLATFKAKQDGEMSQQAKSRFSTALNWLFLFADKKKVYSKQPWEGKDKKMHHTFSFRLAMITLTLTAPQCHTDAEIKELCLQPFLNWLTRSHKCSFVWKAETQLNGNIHFHINVDKFIPWKSVRSKWNSLLAKQGYCKVFNDGSNDKGNAATDISSIKNEKGLAAVVGGYLTRNSIEEKYHFALIEGKKRKDAGEELPFQESEFKTCTTMEKLLEKANFVSCDVRTGKHYTRLIDGRTWGQSESISNIDIRISRTEGDAFYPTEHEFFKDNQLKRLSTVMLNEARTKFLKYSESEKNMLGFDDDTLKKNFSRYENVFIHRNIKFCKLPELLQKKLTDEKAKRSFHGQKNFTVESLF